MAKVVGPGDGKAGFLGGIGVRFMVDGDESGGGFSLVEHPMAPLEPESIPRLVERFDLRFPGESL
jgi:hypothetical protein